jgi:hypothetical protein
MIQNGRWKRTPTNDHVLIQVTMSISIGVAQEFDDLPPGFTDALKDAIKSTGADIIAGSIVPKHRQKYLSTAREILNKISDNSYQNTPRNITED